jgi:penicillin-binding protein activator
MQTQTRGTQCWLALSLVVLALTACTTQTTRVPVDAPMNVSGSWNDTDARVIAEAMVKEALQQPWPRRFTQVTGRVPVVSVGPVVNRTHEPLRTETFVKDLERALANSGQVQFVANAGQVQENKAQADTGKPAGQELGADFMLQGVINTLVDESEGAKAELYQVDLELVDLASNVKVWLGQKKIKKLVERSKTTL